MRIGCVIALLAFACNHDDAPHLRLTRLAPGATERSFVIDGTTRATKPPSADQITATQAPDGTIVILERSVIRRISRDGRLLASVAVEGSVAPLVILPDNSVVVARIGKAPKIFNGTHLQEDLAFTRNAYDAIGKLGVRTSVAIGEIANSPDGTILLALKIDRELTPPEPSVHSSHIGIAKLRRDGTLDRRFGRNGFAEIPGVTYATMSTPMWMHLGVSPDGAVICAYSDEHSYVIRWTADGQPDLRFGTAGRALLDQLPEYLAVDREGRVILVNERIGPPTLAVRRLRNDGSRDASFGVSGLASLHLRAARNRGAVDGSNDYSINFGRIDIDSAGRIVLGGEVFHFAAPCAAVARLLPDGAIDETYGPEGFRLSCVDGNSTAIAVVAGTGDDTFVVSRN